MSPAEKRWRPELRSWDSCMFLAVLNDEEPVASECVKILKLAEEGAVTIVVSALALTEVLKVKGKSPIGPEDEEKVDDFFKRSFIVVRNLDRRTAELARELVWRHGIDPKDAIHVATALIANVDRLDTTDDKLLKRSPLKLERFPSLKMLKPSDPDLSEGLFAAVDEDDEA